MRQKFSTENRAMALPMTQSTEQFATGWRRCGASVADSRVGRNNCGEIVAGNLSGREKHSIFALSKGTNDLPMTERNNK